MQQTDNSENLPEKRGAAKGSECDCCDGVDEGRGGADAASGEQGLKTDIGGPGYMPVVALQGDIEARGRDMKINITFARYMFRTRNGLLVGIFRNVVDEIKPKI